MLISFRVCNYKTFRERAEWSMVASADTTHEAANVVELPNFKLRLLRSAVVYGANASGKSKLVEAMGYMRHFVRTSFTEGEPDAATGTDPFRLHTETAAQPSEFEMLFYHNDDLFRYGFEVTPQRVVSEWLYRRVTTKEHELFYRDDEGLKFGKAFGAARASVLTDLGVRDNILLLSLAAQLNHPQAKAVQEWFGKLRVLSGLDSDGYWGYTMGELEEPASKQAMFTLLQQAGFDLEDAQPEAPDPKHIKFPKDMPKEAREMMLAQLTDATITHQRYDAWQLPAGTADFSLRTDESAGTQLDSRLHPALVCYIVRLFNAGNNPHRAQLLFNTHDTNLLSAGLFRRDQIWFTEKDRYGAATLFSLADFQTDTVRKADNFERGYLQGRYGALPYLGDPAALPTFQPAPADEDAE
jgi:hypothetical protein